ncbi:MAG: DUF4114 domain-containing protein [Oscillatoriales cyanobacterium]|nr:MAG: DUF4114 domain-containing protein [Oscillatoriales cyanobacterium]
MATTNEVSSNLLIDVLITDTLPGSAAKNSILNPLSSSNKQNIGGSALIADTKTQPVIEPEKLLSSTDTLNSKNTIAEPNSKKIDDSLIVSDTLKGGFSGSASTSISRDTLSSSPGIDVKDTLTGSKDSPLVAIKGDAIIATDSLTNPQSVEKIASDKTPTTLAEKETKSEIAIAQNTSVTESKPATTTLAEKETKTEIAIAPNTSVAESKPATTTLADKETKPEIAIAPNTSVTESKTTTSSEPIKSDKLTTEKPATTVADISKDSKQNSTSSSTELDKKVADKTEVTAIETPKSTNTISPKPEIIAANNPFVSGKFLVDSKGQVGIDFVFDGGLYKGQLAIFSLKGMEKFVPGAEEFIKETASRSLSNSAKGHVVIDDLSEGAKFTYNLPEGNSNDGTYLGVKTFAMTPGDEFGVMLVPNGTVREVLNNPAIGGNKRPLFSMATANPNQAFQVGQIADVTGDGSTFAMEDMRVDLGSDRDYNDFVFQVRGAKGNAVRLNDVINPDKDWRKTDMGQVLIAYAKPYVEPKLEPAKQDAKPVNKAPYGSVLDVPIPDIAGDAKAEDKKAIAPVSPAAESVDKTEVVTSDKAVTPAVKIEEDKKAIAPISPGTESVDKTEVITSETSITPAVKIEEDKKAIAPVSPAAESVDKTEVTTSQTTVTPVEKIEEDKKAGYFGENCNASGED